jgi:hypothetical protein
MDPKTAQDPNTSVTPKEANKEAVSVIPSAQPTGFNISSESQSTPFSKASPETSKDQSNDPGIGVAPNSVIQSGKPMEPKGGVGFKIFVIVALIIIAGIYSVVAYLYINNQSLKNKDSGTPEPQVPTESSEPEFSPDQVMIKNGSVVKEVPGRETQTLVAKENYEGTGITGFFRVSVSPDEKNMCFESWAPAPEPALYISSIDGSNVIEVNPNRQNCLWRPDSQGIFYINTSSASTASNIYFFDLASEVEKNLTSESVTPGAVRRFQVVGLNSDSTSLICTYSDVSTELETPKDCEINLSTLEVTLL